MNFELLPNEILIECFKYLNAPDIFYSFDQLCYRFNHLIRNIRLHLNFQDIRKSVFDEFSKKMLSNPQIQKQIYSLQLSNRHTHGQIATFLSLFSLDQFSQLRSLILIDVKKNNMEQLKSMLPLLSQLTSFRLIDSETMIEELVCKLPLSKLKTLSALSVNPVLTSIDQIIPIKYLTVSDFTLDELCRLLLYTPMLHYLNVSSVRKQIWGGSHYEICSSNHRAIHLKHLIITHFKCDFVDLVNFIKHIPNLESLTIFAYDNLDMIDAYRWQELITSSLVYLDTFKFKFAIDFSNQIDDIHDKFQRFQTRFWHQEHHWYTEYAISKYSAFIYTIPYLGDSRLLRLDSRRYFNKSIGNLNTFDNVTTLSLSHEEIKEKCEYYFANITSLEIKSLPSIINEDDKQTFIRSLKRTIDLSKVKHLNISSICSIDISLILLEILKETPNVSSFSICTCLLTSILNNEELCNCLNKMIKKLKLVINQQCTDSDQIKSLCQIFSNIEQLSCKVGKAEDVLFLFGKLFKLSSLSVSMHATPYCLNLIKNQALKLNGIYSQDNYSQSTSVIFVILGIWTDGNNIN